MRQLMDAWADGLNYFLATHPEVKPRVLNRFEPWMVLSFTEGSIGGDIERIDLDAAAKTFTRRQARRRVACRRRSGSAGLQRHRHRADADHATAMRCC